MTTGAQRMGSEVNGRTAAVDVVVWSSEGASQAERVRELVGRRGLGSVWVGGAEALVLAMVRHRPRLVLMLEPEGADAVWRGLEREVRSVALRRFEGVRCMTLPASERNGHASAESVLTTSSEDEGVVLLRPGKGREKLSPVLVHVPDPERLRPPEITQDELRMLLGPYPDEERA